MTISLSLRSMASNWFCVAPMFSIAILLAVGVGWDGAGVSVIAPRGSVGFGGANAGEGGSMCYCRSVDGVGSCSPRRSIA